MDVANGENSSIFHVFSFNPPRGPVAGETRFARGGAAKIETGAARDTRQKRNPSPMIKHFGRRIKKKQNFCRPFRRVKIPSPFRPRPSGVRKRPPGRTLRFDFDEK
jgi:hypothetical protein